MTTGDRVPSPQSTFVGWQVDWQGFEVNPVGDRPLRTWDGVRGLVANAAGNVVPLRPVYGPQE